MMKPLLILLAIASTALSAPVEEAISKADIIKTLEHMQALTREQKEQLDAATARITELNTKLDGAVFDLKGAQDETVKVQQEIDTERAARVAAEKQVAKYHHLLRIVCTILASVAAFLVFEVLQPTGLVGAMFTPAPWVRYAAPVATFAVVFGVAWAAF